MTMLFTGGAGFIGSNFVLDWLVQREESIINLDLLTYAGNHNALSGKGLPIYGDGQQFKDWLYVCDHCRALRRVLKGDKLREVYNVSGLNEKTNQEIARALCDILDELSPKSAGSYRAQITFVKDRPGHNRRYAINADKIARELDWKPSETFETGIRKPVQWFLDNPGWVENVTSSEYSNWINKQYA